MKRITIGIAGLLLAGLAGAGVAQAGLDAAMASGEVGEQSDGYLGLIKPSAGLKAQMDAINIKRREAYTKLAQTKNVPIEAVAASVGCTTLSGLKPGRAYSVVKGVWAIKGSTPIALPSACGG